MRKGFAKVEFEGTVINMRLGPTKHGSYYSRVTIGYYDSYRDIKGNRIFNNMEQDIVGFKAVARKMRHFREGDYVSGKGNLKSIDKDNYPTERLIQIESPKDITKLPDMGEI